jgi:hypothetical protein
MYVYLLNAYLLTKALIIYKIVVLLVQSLYSHDNMAILVFHCPFDIYMNKLHCQQVPYQIIIYLLPVNLLHAYLQVLHNNANGKVYDVYIAFRDLGNQEQHLHNKNDLL